MKVDKEHGEFHALDVDEGWHARRRDRDLFDEFKFRDSKYLESGDGFPLSRE